MRYIQVLLFLTLFCNAISPSWNSLSLSVSPKRLSPLPKQAICLSCLSVGCICLHWEFNSTGKEDANCFDLEGFPQVCLLGEVGGGARDLYEYTSIPLVYIDQGRETLVHLLLLNAKQQLWLRGVSILQSLSWLALMSVIILPAWTLCH